MVTNTLDCDLCRLKPCAAWCMRKLPPHAVTVIAMLCIVLLQKLLGYGKLLWDLQLFATCWL